MIQYARVLEAKDGTVTAVVKRESACGGNCASCAGCADSSLTVTAADPLGAKPGDFVALSMGSGRMLVAALLLYILPLFLLAVSYVVCFSLTGKEGVSTAVCLLVFGASFAALKLFDKKLKTSGKFAAKVEKIIH